jgi:hypothetical protein
MQRLREEIFFGQIEVYIMRVASGGLGHTTVFIVIEGKMKMRE